MRLSLRQNDHQLLSLHEVVFLRGAVDPQGRSCSPFSDVYSWSNDSEGHQEPVDTVFSDVCNELSPFDVSFISLKLM
jgi:hypothetical protein